MTNVSCEDYLKANFKIGESVNVGVSMNKLATYPNIKASSVTQMIQKLDKEGFVNYRKYMGVHLTDYGRKIAVRTIRKHRLWKAFLHKKLKFRWNEVKDLAEELEHIGSETIANRLDNYLNYPKQDPMGMPIPDEDGMIKEQIENLTMYDLEENDRAVISGVLDHSRDFLRHLSNVGLTIGIPFVF
ncbi:MAG: DtxR family Mn-dependent transcriptional regulator [Patiriisocius sp.]|jgi:DtxR family Mn-dependent transcriptional regulator